MYKIWFEYDVGQENMIFSTEEDAIEWFNANPNVKEAAEWEFEGHERLKFLSPYALFDDAGLFRLDKLTLYKG